MSQSKKDFTDKFAAQKAKLRPWAILVIVTIIAIIIVLPIMFFTSALDSTFLMVYITVCAIALLSAIPSFITLSRCPNCKKYMGRDISKHCPVCGVRIQK